MSGFVTATFSAVFEHVVQTCIAAGLGGGEGFAVDASLIAADANKQRSIPGAEWNKECAAKVASRAVGEYLVSLEYAAFGGAGEGRPEVGSPSGPGVQSTGARCADRPFSPMPITISSM